MDAATKTAVLAGVVLFSYTTQAMTGFGSTVIALTLGAHLFPIPELVPVLVALNVPMCLWMVARHRKSVDRELLTGHILPWMGLGLVLGLAGANLLSGVLLRQVFGGLIVIFALREIAALVGSAVPRPELPAAAFRFWIAAAGVVHGVYASGGPMLTYALSRKEMDRSAMRATLLAVWLVFNGAMLAACLYKGAWHAATTGRFLTLLPVVPLGLVLGEALHHRVPEKGFRLTVQAVLTLSGASLLI